MTGYQQETEGYSIVALGAFNPSIFQPLWFSAHNLIRPEEANAAKVEIIHRNATIFKAEWLSLQVIEGNFTAQTLDPTKSLPLRDLVIGTFKLLEHTPLTAFGFNSLAWLSAPTEEQWHAFGHHFAPKESWTEVLQNPGLWSMTIQGNRKNSEGKIRIQIEPAWNFPNGIYIAVNEHHDLPRNDKQPEMTQVGRNRTFLSELQDHWDDFLSYAKSAREHLLAASLSPNTKVPKKKKG